MVSRLVLILVFLSLSFCLFGKQREKEIQFEFKKELLPDSLNIYTLKDVANFPLRAQFLSDSVLSFNQSIKNYWLKITVAPFFKKQTIILSAKYLDTVQFYIPNKNGGYTKIVSGENIALAQRPLKFFDQLGVQLEIDTNPTIVFIKATSVSDFSLLFRNTNNFKISSEELYIANAVKARYYHGIFLGILFAMMIYNFIIFTIYRDKGYAAYALFILTQALYHLSVTGFLTEFFFFNHTELGKYTPYTVAAISLVCFIYFSQVYLNTKKLTPTYHKLLTGLAIFILLTNLMGYFYRMDVANNAMLVQGVAMNTIAFFAAVVAYKKNYLPARYFLIASVLSFASYLIYVLAKLQVLPTVFITRYAFQITVCVQSLLFAIGLADRMRRIVKELAEKKLEKERLEKEQEIAIKNILTQQNEALEKRVQERTFEIQFALNELEQQHVLLETEKQKSENLLLNILPEEIAQELKIYGKAEARDFDLVSILFTDFKGFTEASAKMNAGDLVSEINTCFEAFDGIMEKYGIEKIKTIGDAYMAAGGLPVPTDVSVKNTVLAAIEIQDFIVKRKSEFDAQISSLLVRPGGARFEMRVGIHTGPVVAGIVGVKKFQYDIWGDTVNTASRIESSGEAGKVNISQATYELLKDDNDFVFESRGKIEAKGKGEMEMWFVSKKESQYEA